MKDLNKWLDKLIAWYGVIGLVFIMIAVCFMLWVIFTGVTIAEVKDIVNNLLERVSEETSIITN